MGDMRRAAPSRRQLLPQVAVALAVFLYFARGMPVGFVITALAIPLAYFLIEAVSSARGVEFRKDGVPEAILSRGAVVYPQDISFVPRDLLTEPQRRTVSYVERAGDFVITSDELLWLPSNRFAGLRLPWARIATVAMARVSAVIVAADIRLVDVPQQLTFRITARAADVRQALEAVGAPLVS